MLCLKVVCTELPGTCFEDPYESRRPVKQPVYLGIQRGREVVEQVRADRPRVTFTPGFEVAKRADGALDFRGPFAQGRPGGRFFYLSWGVRDSAGAFSMFRRLKVPLRHLRSKDVERAIGSGQPIVVKLRLTDEKGGPLCATPPPTHIAWEMSKARAKRRRSSSSAGRR